MSSALEPDDLASIVEDLATDIEAGRQDRPRIYGADDALPPAAAASLERMAPQLEERHRAVFGER
ncbi:MAG: hypothetical protein ACRBI6_20435 [Acidimicrobiales bacterium]